MRRWGCRRVVDWGQEAIDGGVNELWNFLAGYPVADRRGEGCDGEVFRGKGRDEFGR